MSNHIFFDDNTQYGRRLRQVLGANETADDIFADVRDVMVQMLEGDGSQDAHYSTIATRFGFKDINGAVSSAVAHAAFLEIDSAYSKTSGDGTVSNVRAARDQLFAKLRG